MKPSETHRWHHENASVYFLMRATSHTFDRAEEGITINPCPESNVLSQTMVVPTRKGKLGRCFQNEGQTKKN